MSLDDYWAKVGRRGPEDFELRQDNTLLGTLRLEGVDPLFFVGVFTPTSAFQAIAPLFEEEMSILEHPESSDGKTWEAARSRIDALSLRLVPTDGDGRASIDNFLLHIKGQEAWLRY
jgi:hypothetical protein